MRLAKIDLDWLKEEIASKEMALKNPLFKERDILIMKSFKVAYEEVLSNCTLIEEEKNKESLPKTCLNQWEDKKYCSNEGMCQMCKQ